MATEEIDAYLRELEEPKRSSLETVRRRIVDVIPGAEQGVSYAIPAFRVNGVVVAGFAAFKNHLTYVPHSGSVFPELREQLAGYQFSTGALRFPVDEPLSADLIRLLIEVRLRQAFPIPD